MKPGSWRWLKGLMALLMATPTEPAQHAERIVALQRNIVLPARMVLIGVVFYMLYQSPWLSTVVTTYGVMFETIVNTIWGYAFLIIAAVVLFAVVRKFPPGTV